MLFLSSAERLRRRSSAAGRQQARDSVVPRLFFRRMNLDSVESSETFENLSVDVTSALTSPSRCGCDETDVCELKTQKTARGFNNVITASLSYGWNEISQDRQLLYGHRAASVTV